MNELVSNTALLERRRKAVPRGVVSATPIFATRASNAELWDADGRRFIDFAGGIGVLAVGHCHPRVIDAVMHQARTVTHTAFQVAAYEPYIRLAERLNALAPFRAGAQTLLVTTGAEAVENAIKIARIATGRTAVIAFSGAFHGRTLLTMALTGKVVPYKRAAGALAPDVYRVPFPTPYNGVTVADTLRAFESLFYADLEATRVAAIIIEPVQGEGGFHVAASELLRAIRTLCDQHGIVFIADEVQSGFGRTGRMFAIEHADVEPDLVTVAKSLAGGLPLAAVIGRTSLMDKLEPGALGGTYGGSPVGCAAALAVLDVIAEENLLQRATTLGTKIRTRIDSWIARADLVPVRNVRGLGAMIAFDVPDGAAARRVSARALELGLIVLTCGRQAETLRLLMPLTIGDATLDEGMSFLEQSLRGETP